MRDEIELILPTSWEPNQNEFLKALRISAGGLGEQFFGTVYDALFIDSIEVKGEFQRYYSVEYANLAEYMEIRYGEILGEDDLEAKRIFIVNWLPQVVHDDYDNNKLSAVLECIAQLGKAGNENQT